ncbi:MAG: hypothetical protein HKN25_14215, partial [Pyrinomonadaceae bacterium]|nr:hypothetical protein [Pyrinomonadaceae bacterium]
MMTNRQPASRSLDSAYQLCSFIKASYTIKVAEAYDDTPEIEIEASIELQTFKDAKPVFELGVDLDQLKKYPLLLKLHVDDDKKPAPCEAARFHGDGEVPLIAISKKLAPGLHTIKMKYNMAIMARAGQAISQIRDGLSLRFVMSDLGDRNSQFLGQYLPSNLAFDRYRMKFDVAMTSNRRCYTLITNKGVAERDKVEKKNKKKSGKGKSKSDDGKIINRWKFDTLEYYKASFIWFHLFPSDTHLIHQKDIVIGDKKIWTTVYGSKEEFKPPGARISRLLALYMNRCVEYLNYFIRRYGDFPTNYLTVLMRA